MGGTVAVSPDWNVGFSPQREGTSGTHQKSWIGDSLPVISSKLKQCILNWEYVDLAK